MNPPSHESRLLLAYRLLAWVTGALLLVLVFIAVPLKYIWDSDGLNSFVGLVHGIFFYPLYVVLAFALGFRDRWTLLKIALVVLAGAVPIMSFVAERAVTRTIRASAPTRPS